MDFDTAFSVTIGDKLILTVHSVRTKYDSSHLGASCDIVVPLNCRVQYNNGKNEVLTEYALNEFKTGDPVTVKASYPNTGFGDVTLFEGSVWEFKEGMPCTIKCINYLALQGNIKDYHYKSASLKTIITDLLSATKPKVNLILPMPDINLVDFTFRSVSPWAGLEYFKKTLGLNISLRGSDLYCNVASNTMNVVTFSSDRNIFKNDMQQPDTVWQGYKVKAWFINANGSRDSIEVGGKEGHMTEVYFYKVAGGEAVHQRLATEALNKCLLKKYSGKVHGYLYPIVQLFDKIKYTDIRYPARSGEYVVTGLSHTLDDSGFHVEMQWAFLTDFLNRIN